MSPTSAPERIISRQVKIAVLRAAARATHPTTALPTIASHHSLTIEEAKAIVHAHGWPKPHSMLHAADLLEARDTAAQAPAAAPDDSTGPTRKLVTVRTELLHPDPDNIRDDLGDITELADSIAAVGILQPIVVRRHKGRLIVVAGHRRLAAVQRLLWDEVDVVVLEDMHPDQVLAAMLIENTQRTDLDPIEEARALKALKERDGLTDTQIGHRIGRSQMHVSNRIALLALSPAQQGAIRARTMTLADGASAGRKRNGTHRPNAQGKKSAAHLTRHHPLAEAVAELCQQQGHNKHTPGRIGDVGCGRCWEATIRADERARLDGSER